MNSEWCYLEGIGIYFKPIPVLPLGRNGKIKVANFRELLNRLSWDLSGCAFMGDCIEMKRT